MTKTIDTLVDDIYTLLRDGKDVSDADAKVFGERMEELIKTRLAPREDRDFTLRMSNIGRAANQLWYESKGYPREEIPANVKMKFLYGDIVEELSLFLAEQAGHTVTHQQKEVEVEGVKGHMDCKIDGVTMDVKSTSGFAFKKFKEKKLYHDDPFGYIAQISGYVHAEGETEGGFFAINRDHGHMCTMMVSKDKLIDAPGRINYLKNILSKDEPPSKAFCQELKTEKNGNEILGSKCSFCDYKHDCHKGLRTFLYSTGPKFFTKVESLPRVYEVTDSE